MTDLKPIFGKLLFAFPPERPAAYQIHEGDGFNIWLTNPHGDSVSVSKYKLLIILRNLFDNEFKKS